jgi:uncharacterized SAM-binding protein YcdF (DUF218 family)
MGSLDRTVSEREASWPNRTGLMLGSLRLLFNAMVFGVGLLIIGFFVFVAGLARHGTNPPKADGIAVLTGGSARIDEAMSLLADGKAQRLLISGVYRDTTKKQLEKLAGEGGQYFTCCVDLDHEARNTIDNATETSQWVRLHRYHSIIVVTSNYHMPRALAELGRTMPGIDLIPYPVIDKNVHLERWWLYPGTTKLLLSEYLKFLPAIGRLGATRLVNKAIYGKWSPRPVDVGGP